MDSFSWFIVAVLSLLLVNNMHRRATRARLIRELQEEGKSAKDIATIMKAYSGEEQ